MKQYRIAADGKSINFKAYDDNRAIKHGKRIAAEHKIWCPTLYRRRINGLVVVAEL